METPSDDVPHKGKGGACLCCKAVEAIVDHLCPKCRAGLTAKDTLGVDLEHAAYFLSLLDPTTEVFTFQTFDESREKDPSLARVLHGTTEEHAPELARLNRLGAGVFVTVNETDLRGSRSNKQIVRVRAVFVDLDNAPLGPVLTCRVLPHIIVNSSPQKWHAYWLVDTVQLDEFKGIQRRIAQQFNGDKGVSDLARVMRLPGFRHCKPQAVHHPVVRILSTRILH